MCDCTDICYWTCENQDTCKSEIMAQYIKGELPEQIKSAKETED